MSPSIDSTQSALTLPPEILYQIAMLCPLATLSAFRRTSKNFLKLLPSGDELLKREFEALLQRYSVHEALGRSLHRAAHYDRCARHIGQTAHMRLVRMLVANGGTWGKAFGHVWGSQGSARRKEDFDDPTIVRLIAGSEGQDAERVLADYGNPPHNATDYGIWLWEAQMVVIKRWCKLFGEANDVPTVRSFVPVLGVFEVAALARCAEVVRDAEAVWTEWR